MSHTLSVSKGTVETVVTLTIQNYTAGGEAVTLAELLALAITTDPAQTAYGLQAVFFATVPAGQNSLGVPLFPMLSGGNVLLFQFSAGTFVQIPTTSALNAVVNAIVVFKLN